MANSNGLLFIGFVFFLIYLRMIFTAFGNGSTYEQKSSLNLTDEFVWRDMTVGDVQKMHAQVHPFLYKVFHSGDQFRNFDVSSFKSELRKVTNVAPQDLM